MGASGRRRDELPRVRLSAAPTPATESEQPDQFGIRLNDWPKSDVPGVDHLDSFLARPRNTAATYFAMHTVGGKSDFIPRHFHRLHTENFFCLDGRLLLHVNGRQILMTAGDFVHAPASTVHSFAFDSHHTQMLGLLTTGVFEKFFDYMATPTEGHIYTDDGQLDFPADGFARARAELDLEVVGPPPERVR